MFNLWNGCYRFFVRRGSVVRDFFGGLGIVNNYFFWEDLIIFVGCIRIFIVICFDVYMFGIVCFSFVLGDIVFCRVCLFVDYLNLSCVIFYFVIFCFLIFVVCNRFIRVDSFIIV